MSQFTQANRPIPPHRGKSVFSQLAAMQRVLVADATNPLNKPMERATCARVAKELMLARHQLKCLPFAKPVEVLAPEKVLRRIKEAQSHRVIDVSSEVPDEAERRSS